MEQKTYLCDLCARAYPSRDSVLGSVNVGAGADAIFIHDVCDECVRGLAKIITDFKIKTNAGN